MRRVRRRLLPALSQRRSSHRHCWVHLSKRFPWSFCMYHLTQASQTPQGGCCCTHCTAEDCEAQEGKVPAQCRKLLGPRCEPSPPHPTGGDLSHRNPTIIRLGRKLGTQSPSRSGRIYHNLGGTIHTPSLRYSRMWTWAWRGSLRGRGE